MIWLEDGSLALTFPDINSTEDPDQSKQTSQNVKTDSSKSAPQMALLQFSSVTKVISFSSFLLFSFLFFSF